MTTSLSRRYEQARSACVLFHLEDWAVFRLTGGDTRDFLNRLSTANVKTCAAGDAIQTLFLQGDGRIVADCIAFCESEERFYLICPMACSESLEAQLDRFLFSEKVTVENVTDSYYIGMTIGPARQLFGDSVKKKYLARGVEGYIFEVVLAPAASRLIVLIPQSGFAELQAGVYQDLDKRGGVVGGADLFETLRIEDGCPLFGRDTSSKTIPLEANQKPAISFTKGCFPGQEIVARINNLGHPANVLVGLVLPETTVDFAGRQLKFNDKIVGRITSVCYSSALKAPLALGYVKWNNREAGQLVEVDGDAVYEAVVVEVPLAGISS